jgi:hypothetical protein
MNKIPALALLLVAIGLGSLVVGLVYTAYNASANASWIWQGQSQQGMMGRWYQQLQNQSSTPITIEQAKTIAQQYLVSTRNPNLAIKEIMEFQYNFYIIYYEKDTGLGAFEMLIWKRAPPSGIMGGGMMGGGMMGGYTIPGAIMPEPGPNMMWNTKYSPMRNGMMGFRNQAISSMTVSESVAQQRGQSYLDANFKSAKTEMATQFYGYYTFDFTVEGKIAGMLSVNGYTGQVWYHSWHGAFIQEVEFE